jgi:nitrogen fixation NifU-like protein
MLSLEQQLIIERYKQPLFAGSVSAYTHSSSGTNASCGDEIAWQARVEGDVITELKHQTRACAVCTASADMLAEMFSGKPLETVQHHTNDEQAESLGIPLSPVRRKCAVLPLEALKNLSPNL